MAFEIGIGEKHLRLIEKGTINTGVSTLFKIAEVLDIPYSQLLDFELTDYMDKER